VQKRIRRGDAGGVRAAAPRHHRLRERVRALDRHDRGRCRDRLAGARRCAEAGRRLHAPDVAAGPRLRHFRGPYRPAPHRRDDRGGAAGTVLYSYRLWQTQFGGDTGAIGVQVTLDGAPYTIIGVMPREFCFPRSDALVWTTMRFNEGNYQDRNDNWLEAVGRLRPGVTLQQARVEMDLLAAQSTQQYPKDNEHIGINVIPLRDEVSQQSRLLLVALSGAAACVLLIACANLANLLLVRALGRRRELAVRTAMGAGRERLIRQLMTESLLLAGVGGVLGVAVAVVAVPLL